jgi:hypothetical protein
VARLRAFVDVQGGASIGSSSRIRRTRSDRFWRNWETASDGSFSGPTAGELAEIAGHDLDAHENIEAMIG